MRTCSIDGCDKKHKGLGYCEMHYYRHKRGSDMNAPPQEDNRCIEDSCERTKSHESYCKYHARHKRVGPYALTCSFTGCLKDCTVYTPQLCESHYRQHRLGQELKPLRLLDKQKRVTKSGYVTVFMPDHPNAGRCAGRVSEHTLVMSDHLGRALVKGESVHHKNGDRADNRIENLELWSTSQPAGQRVEDKVRWAREILERYGDQYP